MSIGSDHTEFAKAVVRLAREHKMDNLSLTFRRSVSEHIGKEGNGPETFDNVSMQWHSERHGSRGTIVLRSEAISRVPEEPPLYAGPEVKP